MTPTEIEAKTLFEPQAVADAVRLIVGPGAVTELRALDATTVVSRWPHTASGYFDDPDKLAEALKTIKTAKGIYFVPNPIEPALLARAANRLRKTPKGESTADTNITRRRWLLVDCDAQRPSGISSTDTEHIAAIGRAREVFAWLRERGWPDPIAADSGNGAHLLYSIELPASDGGIVQSCLQNLAVQFDDDTVKVDQKVFNPARIWKLYGTLACKGDDTPDRPHRMARILSKPENLEAVSIDLLRALASEGDAPAVAEPERTSRNGVFDLEAFIARNGLDVEGPDDWHGQQGLGQRWALRQSPMCDHHNDGPHILRHAGGAISAGCHHNSCSWTWADLRAKCEPRLASLSSGEPSTDLAGAAVSLKCVNVNAYKPFPIHCLPGPVGDYVRAAAKAIGCDPSYIALPLLACLARAIGNKRVIRLKRSWTEPAVVWAAIIGKSGSQKTPALQAATGPLLKRQSEAMAGNAEKEKDYEQAMAEYRKEMLIWRRKKTDENAPWEPERPKCERFVASDCTIEALASLLDGQFDGVLVARDELSGWINGIAEYKGGKGSDCGHWLACWSAQPLIVDRKTGDKKTISIDRASVSLCGGIQPGILANAIGREHMQDGLCARLLFAMPPARVITWTEATIDVETELTLSQVFTRLLDDLEPALDENEEPAPYPLDLSDEAWPLWTGYYDRHRAEMIELDDDLAAAWSKLEAYTARFALIFQLCKWAAGDATAGSAIDEQTMLAAIELSDWFGSEAKRVYGLFVENEQERERRELVEWITRKGGSVTAREVQQGHRHYRTADDTEAALDELAKADYGGWEDVLPGPKGGRPSRVFRLSTLSTSTQPHETGDIEGFVDVDTVNAPETQHPTQPDGDWGEI